MTDSIRHLREEERHALADATIDAGHSAAATAHLERCAECASDVARIRTLMTRAREPHIDDGSFEELWPGIRSRIEARKLIPIAAAERVQTRVRVVGRRKHWAVAAAAVAAAAVVAIIAIRARTLENPDAIARRGDDTTVSFVVAADSVHSYEIEAQALLDRLELQRAILRPEAAQLLQRDLRSIDVAIAELKGAIARDPKNATLRQLLASSYRQKIELLKRANNAS